MLNPIDFPSILSVSAFITAVGGAWLTVRKIAKDTEKRKKEWVAEILQHAKEADQANRTNLEVKIHDLELQLKVLRETMDKELEYIKKSHDSEFKHLSEKIENLRQELASQHSNILSLLTKMVSN